MKRMTFAEFDGLVRRVETRFANQPRKLRIRTALLAILGYATFLSWIGLVLVLAALLFRPALMVHFTQGWILLLLASIVTTASLFGMIRVLWVRIDPPEGRALTREEAPALHSLIDEIRKELHAASYYEVQIIAHCNASVSEVPQLGVLGWHRNYLQIGLPILETLSIDELRAVLAHEGAHLSARHGRFQSWIYRLRRSWHAAFTQKSSSPPGATGFPCVRCSASSFPGFGRALMRMSSCCRVPTNMRPMLQQRVWLAMGQLPHRSGAQSYAVGSLARSSGPSSGARQIITPNRQQTSSTACGPR